MIQDETSFYQIGGSLAKESPSYVERIADRELETALKKGEFCYVLNSRQMGKSSLRVRTMSKLQAEGTVCIFIDLTAKGTRKITAEKWYAGIVLTIVKACQLKLDWRDWWRKQRDLLTPVERLNLFIEEILLVEVRSNIVIFVDEIDRVLSQNFSLDDFFAWIHSCYQKRQVNPDYLRLTFTLLGVAAPRNLIRDRSFSPFELGKAINLQGFRLEEAEPLMAGLIGRVERPKEILAEILTQTAGQPFLTQKICQLVIKELDKTNKLSIAQIIEEYLIKNWQAQDEPEHLRTIRDRLYYRNSTRTICLLNLYQNVLQKNVVPIDSSIEQIELRLSGLVVEREGNLEINNPIYAKVFNLAWVKKQLAQLRPYESQLASWLVSKNPAYLLKGEDLQAASIWSLGKSLADTDYQFLVASHESAKQRIENTLADVTAANELLANARKTAVKKVRKQRPSKKWLSTIALGITISIVLLRYTGIFQTWEWNLLDRFFRWRVSNYQEPQIVVVTVGETDLQTVRQYPISDRVLASAIKNLARFEPSAIALDLYRDLPVPPGQQNLSKVLKGTNNLYVAEKVVGNPILPPCGVNSDRVGFTDLILDGDGRVRRALLSISDKRSLGTRLALHYLHERNIRLIPLDDKNHRYGLGQATFERLDRRSGGYTKTDVRGYQILLNYWGTSANFEQYSLIDVLQDRVNAEAIRDRLVIIGSTAESIEDTFYTPYSNGWFRRPPEMPGVFIHANVTSQIINAAMGRSPLLHTLSKFGEFLIILFVGIIGVITSWRSRSSIAIAVGACAISIISIVACYRAFLLGWWLPLLPALLILIAIVVAAIILKNKQRDRLIFEHTLKSVLNEFPVSPIVARIALQNLKRSENKANSYLIEEQIKKLTE